MAREPMKDPIPIQIAATAAEREAVYAFRYGIYVEEMGKQLQAADHAQRRLTDEMDEPGVIFYAEEGGAIIGTLRINFGPDEATIAKYLGSYQLDRFAAFPRAALAISSRLMVAKSRRGSEVLRQLVTTAYLQGLERGILFDFCHCTPGLVSLYEHIGYRRYTDNFLDAEAGYRVPMVLILRDMDHLRAIGSPFSAVLAARTEAARGRDESAWFARTFAAASPGCEWLLTPEDFWRILCEKLARSPTERTPLLQGLSEEEAQAVLAKATLLRCRRGDHFIRREDVGQEMYLLLSGLMEVREAGTERVVAVLGPGQTIGELSFLLGCPRSADVLVQDDAEVLVVNQSLVQRLADKAPALAAKVFLNLSRIVAHRMVSRARSAPAGGA